MGRPSKPHLTGRGTWRVRIRGKEYNLGRDKAAALRRYHELMAQVGRPVRKAAPLERSMGSSPRGFETMARPTSGGASGIFGSSPANRP